MEQHSVITRSVVTKSTAFFSRVNAGETVPDEYSDFPMIAAQLILNIRGLTFSVNEHNTDIIITEIV